MKLLLLVFAVCHASIAKSFPDNYNVLDSAAFSVQLYKTALNESQNENMLLSPISILNALGLAYMASEGETADEIYKTLGLAVDIPCVVSGSFKKSTEYYKRLRGVSIANKIYVKQGLHLKEEFVENARTNFDSDVEEIDFVKDKEAVIKMNAWFENKTNHKIKKLFSSDSINSDTSVIIGNAVYFNSFWKYPFNNVTIRKNFWINENTSVETDMMFTLNKFKTGFSDELDCQIIVLPYNDSGLQMMILLPIEKNGLHQLEDKLSPTSILSSFDSLYETSLSLYIPKFTFEKSVSLNNVLQKMGLKSMFSDAANFNDMFKSNTGNVKVSDIIQKTFIRVDEKGTEAAAATGIKFLPLSVLETVTVDHPFVFAIIDLVKADILFIGNVKSLESESQRTLQKHERDNYDGN